MYRSGRYGMNEGFNRFIHSRNKMFKYNDGSLQIDFCEAP